MSILDLFIGATNRNGPYREAKGDELGNLCTTYPVDGLPVQKFLTTTGVSTFTSHTVNYAATPTDIYYKATGHYEVHTVLINVSDNASFNQLDFGGIAGGLTNGINFWVGQGGIITKIPLFNNTSIKNNAQWFSLAHEASLTTFAGTAQTQSILIEVTKTYGKPLHLSTNDCFGMTLHDDFSTLTTFTIQLRGILY